LVERDGVVVLELAAQVPVAAVLLGDLDQDAGLQHAELVAQEYVQGDPVEYAPERLMLSASFASMSLAEGQVLFYKTLVLCDSRK